MIQTNVGGMRPAVDFKRYAEGHYLFLIDTQEVVVIDTLSMSDGMAYVTSLTGVMISDNGEERLDHRSRLLDLNEVNHINCHLSERHFISSLRHR